MYQSTYDILGMTCSGCQKKISEHFNSLPNIQADVNLETQKVTIESTAIIDLTYLNEELKKIGHYQLVDPNQQTSDFIPPQDRVSPSSVYYCPMECEGEKVYFVQGKRCPVCNMYCVPIEEKSTYQAPIAGGSLENIKDQAGKYYCPMFCEGDKVYDSNVGCPVCGMDLVKIPGGADEKEDETYKILRNKFIISLLLTIPVFILSMGGMWINFSLKPQTQGFIELVLTLPIVFYTGWFILKRAITSFRTLHLNMFSLIGLGVFAALLMSMIALFFPQILPHEFLHAGKLPFYFESVAVILTLVILGQMLEAKAHQKTSKAIEELMNLTPDVATVIINGVEKETPLIEVKVGQLVKIKSGEKIPVDGIVIDGTSLVDESMITGEPIPTEKNIGDSLIGGTLNTNGSLVMKVKKVGDQTTLSKIIQLVNEASRSKAPIQKTVDKISKIFVPTVIGIALLTFLLWSIFGDENRYVYAFINAISVLIVACPCALGLATPMSLMVGIGKGAKNGILIKNAEALEQLHKVNVLITDKTGTLTEGNPTLEKIITVNNFEEKEALELAYALNQDSTHPLSQAISKQFSAENKPSIKIEKFENITGKGLKAVYQQETLLLGNESLLEQYTIPFENIKNQLIEIQKSARTYSILSIGEKIAGIFIFHDPIKKNAAQAISFLQSKNIDVVMMTGDNYETAKQVAQQLQIKDVEARVLPHEKLSKVKKLQQKGKLVAMTGDGINDAPALMQANIGIAMGNGSDIAIESAELTLLKGDIMGVAKSYVLSEKLLKNIKENLWFAFCYNCIGIPIAAGILYPIAGILMSPMLAAAAMSLSSVSVILNSLRLNRLNIEQSIHSKY